METDWLEVSFGRIVKGGKKGLENSAFAGLETVKALNEGNGFFFASVDTDLLCKTMHS